MVAIDEYKQYSTAIKDAQLRNAFDSLARADKWIEANVISSNMLKALPNDMNIVKLNNFVKKKIKV